MGDGFHSEADKNARWEASANNSAFAEVQGMVNKLGANMDIDKFIALNPASKNIMTAPVLEPDKPIKDMSVSEYARYLEKANVHSAAANANDAYSLAERDSYAGRVIENADKLTAGKRKDREAALLEIINISERADGQPASKTLPLWAQSERFDELAGKSPKKLTKAEAAFMKKYVEMKQSLRYTETEDELPTGQADLPVRSKLKDGGKILQTIKEVKK